MIPFRFDIEELRPLLLAMAKGEPIPVPAGGWTPESFLVFSAAMRMAAERVYGDKLQQEAYSGELRKAVTVAMDVADSILFTIKQGKYDQYYKPVVVGTIGTLKESAWNNLRGIVRPNESAETEAFREAGERFDDMIEGYDQQKRPPEGN